MKSKIIGECYICGGIKELTDDHIPPESLFPHPIPQDYNLITVPACLDCNTRWGIVEQKFIQDLSIVGASKSGHAVFTQNTRANYLRGTLLRGRPSKDYFDIISRMKKVYLRTEGGIILPNPVHIFKIPQERDEILVKMARGFHAHFKGKRLPSRIYANVIMRVPTIQEHFFDLYRARSIMGRYGEVFSYVGGFPNDSENLSFWFLGFYTNIDFLVLLSSEPFPEDKNLGSGLFESLPMH